MTNGPLKPAQAADAAAERAAAEADALGRAWWRRVPRVLTAPREVFVALRRTDDPDVGARAEPVLAIMILAGMAAVLLTPAGAGIANDSTVDGLVIAVWVFIAGGIYGAASYFVLGLALWVGAKAVGVEVPARSARQLLGFAALPVALSLVVLVPVIALGFGEDWFRAGGDDEGTPRALVIGVGLAFVAWTLGLVAYGLRVTLRLPWQGVIGALALGGVLVGGFVVLPLVL